MTSQNDTLIGSLAALARQEESGLDQLARQGRAQDVASPVAPARMERLYDLATAGLLGRPSPVENVNGAAARLTGHTQPARALPGRPARLGRRTFSLMASAVMAVGAAGVTVGVLGSRNEPGQAHSLPVYALELTGGVAAERGTPAAPADPREAWTLLPDATMSFVLRPEDPVSTPLAADAFVRLAGGDLRPVTLPIQLSPSGAVRVAGRVATLFPELQGPATLVLVVRNAALRPLSIRQVVGAEISGPGWRKVSFPVVFGEPGARPGK